MLPCIRFDRPLALESMRGPVFEIPCGIDLVNAILEQVGDLPLQTLQLVNWRVDRALSAIFLGNLKGGIFLSL